MQKRLVGSNHSASCPCQKARSVHRLTCKWPKSMSGSGTPGRRKIITRASWICGAIATLNFRRWSAPRASGASPWHVGTDADVNSGTDRTQTTIEDTRMNQIILCATVILLGTIAASASAQRGQANADVSIDDAFAQALATSNVPGAVIAVVAGDTVAFLRAAGRARFGEDAPLEPDAVFRVGGVTELING